MKQTRLGRGMLGVLDQAISAAGNMLLLICVASHVSSIAFGKFALTYAIYVFILGLSRAINSEPLIVTSSGRITERTDISRTLGGALLLGLLTSVGCLCVGLASGDLTFLVFAAFLPALLIQDAARMGLMAEGRPAAALSIDCIWTGIQLVLLIILISAQVADIVAFVLAWAVPGTISALFACLVFKLPVRLPRPLPRVGLTRTLQSRYALEFLSGAGALQIVHFAIAGIVGLAAIGGLRAAQTLLSPFNQLLTGLTVGLMPEIVRLRRERPEILIRVLLIISSSASLVVLAGTILLRLMPNGWGEALLGDTWSAASNLLIPAGLAIAANMWILGPLLGLRAGAASARSLSARLIGSAAMVISASATLLLTTDVVAVVWAIGICACVTAPLWWRTFIQHEKQEVRELPV